MTSQGHVVDFVPAADFISFASLYAAYQGNRQEMSAPYDAPNVYLGGRAISRHGTFYVFWRLSACHYGRRGNANIRRLQAQRRAVLIKLPAGGNYGADRWARNMTTQDELRLEVENLDLRRLLKQAGIDAAEHKVVERLQRVLLEELHHRVKNTLAIVMAITSQSLRSADNVEHGMEAINHQLMALGRVHDLLLQTNWGSTSLAEILKTAIDPFDTGGASRFSVQSSDIEVSSGAVLPLTMVLNELCTNAVKYGALSNGSGGVQITATVDDLKKTFRLRWAETGGPTVRAPTHRSLGTRLIEQSFWNPLRAESQLSFEPAGVVCVLEIPLESLKKLPSN